MALSKQIRLFKIASEINIGKDAIVEFLNGKGFAIENKPTSMLTDEMVDAVYEKFKKEKKAAEKQREKILKHKEIKKPLEDGEDRIDTAMPTDQKAHTATPPVAEKPVQHVEQQPERKIAPPSHKEVEEIAAKAKAEPVKAIEEKPAPAKAEVVSKEPKVGEVIDLKRAGGSGRRDKPGKSAGKQKETEAEAVTALEDRKAPETVPVEVEEPAVIPTEVPPVEEIKEVETAEEEEGHPKKKKKRKKLVEIEVEPGEAPKLRGLTIVGKIDLQAAKPKKDKVKGKKQFEEGEEEEGLDKAVSLKFKKKGKVKGKDKLVVPDRERADDKRKKKKKKTIRESISQEDVDKAIRETLSGMGDHHLAATRARLRQRKKAEREEKELKIAEEKQKESTILRLTEFVTTNDLANLLEVTANEIILKCMQLGLMVTINQRLDKDTIMLIADDYGFQVEFVESKAEVEEEEEEEEVNLMPRSPIVTIMGHVDHGKTSLLDYIRHSNVVSGEAGGITQHIAAYRVETSKHKHITFLDTPGHEAFTAMRARGAQVTDIVVLVVAADDSVMPQTLEAISHAQAAQVPIIVAINKIDKPDARPDRIKQQLADQKILVEEWGGKYQSVEISAKTGKNIEQLLEKILLEAELLELKANPDRKAKGAVIEAHMSKGLGTVATVIVQKGTLKVGDTFVAGVCSGKVRVLLDERGNKVEEARPSMPVGVIGFDGLPEAGDVLSVVESDVDARNIANQRQQLKREQELRQVKHITLDEISRQISIGGVKELRLIIKGDVSGSVEALSDSLLRLSRDEVRVTILHKGVGTITESDVMLAIASGAVIIGFQVSPTTKARKLADAEAVDIRQYNIIYDCINEVQLALEGLLSPEIKEEITSSIEIRKIFKVSNSGNIAGCYVLSGKITRNDKVRLMRAGLPIHTGTLRSLKRGKDDVREVEQGYECGIQVDGYNDIRIGDIIEGYKLVEVKRTLN